ncbi:hypothetical protein T440DRAFT_151689 [Plenodomus tracheiphilus IPT5]|uniref:Uncharacterized protein n=1 Tax=Plenodomus tracheiphilus IPT5 TaxID=1408161 RepID=A0A6A7B2X8_9PLEO|nr:hypothetical protein T440DRAFT_151689 [Plenodomus tracheiphilus IPT5]
METLESPSFCARTVPPSGFRVRTTRLSDHANCQRRLQNPHTQFSIANTTPKNTPIRSHSNIRAKNSHHCEEEGRLEISLTVRVALQDPIFPSSELIQFDVGITGCWERPANAELTAMVV